MSTTDLIVTCSTNLRSCIIVYFLPESIWLLVTKASDGLWEKREENKRKLQIECSRLLRRCVRQVNLKQMVTWPRRSSSAELHEVELRPASRDETVGPPDQYS